ncbi:hypothetical protein [Sphingomonas abaci]|uniref:Methylphosphotriester-DNA--protein-cysteine methyltransferase n=1 Tax=Sphingomonas abaci TaxID=237611 RepID=A0A7W7AKT0_9SPHN|nr:hypothetical protein [Sphingomonas abaci]MBB4618656.1 methylphosphotriester-DNA--protein-cysteine methyltransferase [Sphingomonas abaci]
MTEAATCAAKAAHSSTFSVARMMGLTTAATMLGGQSELAEALGIQPRSLRAKFSAERGVSDDDLRSAADALDRQAKRIMAHAEKLRTEAAAA